MKVEGGNAINPYENRIAKEKDSIREKSPFYDALVDKSKNTADNECELIGKYTDGNLGFTAYIYDTSGNDCIYRIKMEYKNGCSETRDVDPESIDASNCNIVDLYAKLKYIESNKKIEGTTLSHVISHFNMEHGIQGANGETKLNWISLFEKQLELEKQQNNNVFANKLERLLLYL